MDVDNQPAVLRCQDDLADERSKTLGGFHSIGSLCIAQRRVQGRHLLSIEGRHFRVEKRRGLRRFSQDALQLRLARLELNHLGIYPLSSSAFEDQVQRRVELTVDPPNFRPRCLQ